MVTLRAVVVSFGFVCWMVCLHCADGRMSAWRDITKCNAKPCRCYDKNERCFKGLKMQTRVCEYNGEDFLASLAACKDEFDKDGTIRTKRCWNKKTKKNDPCPGWSEWEITSECERNDDGNWTQTQERHCNNPPPLHPKVLCMMTNGLQAMREQDNELVCEPEEEVEVTTQAMSTGTELPCCEEGTDYSAYDENSESSDYNDNVPKNETTTAGATIAPLSKDEQDYYDQFYVDNGADCRPCGNSTADSEMDYYQADGTTELPSA